MREGERERERVIEREREREKERERKWNVQKFWTDKDKENGFILASSLSEIKKVSGACNYRVVINLNFILCIYLFNSKQK